MNKLVLSALIFLTSLNALASAREFRINREAVVDGGYAVAWGIPGEKIDFEAIDADEKKADEFVQKKGDFVHNYIVDLETNKILTDITKGEGDMVDFTIGKIHVGNHYRVTLNRVEVHNMPGFNSEAVAVIEHNKWSNDFSHLLIVDRDNNQRVVIDASNVQEKIQTELLKKMSAKEKDKFQEGAVTIEIASTFLDKYGTTNVVTLRSEVPKSSAPAIEVRAYVTLTVNNGAIDVKVLSQKTRVD